jgi:hypothetical protein
MRRLQHLLLVLIAAGTFTPVAVHAQVGRRPTMPGFSPSARPNHAMNDRCCCQSRPGITINRPPPQRPGYNPFVPSGPNQNPFVPSGPNHKPKVPGGQAHHPIVPGGPGQKPIVPRGPGQNPLAPGRPGQNPFVPAGPGDNAFVPRGPALDPFVPVLLRQQNPLRPNNQPQPPLDLGWGIFVPELAPQRAAKQPLKNPVQQKKPAIRDFDRLAQEQKAKEDALAPVKTVEEPALQNPIDAPVQDQPAVETKTTPALATGLESLSRIPVADSCRAEATTEEPRRAQPEFAVPPTNAAGLPTPVLVFLAVACVFAVLGAAIGLVVHLERHDEQVIAGRNKIVTGLPSAVGPMRIGDAA